MSEYSKKTVAELQEILKSRSLPTSGKKADLIARLTEADKPSQVEEPAPAPAQTSAPTEPTPAPAEPQLEAPETVAPAENGATAQSEQTVEAQEDASKSYTLNLKASDVDDEMAKRKARAARFNTGVQMNAEADSTETATADSDALKNLERAKRFGTGTTAIGKLDEALPTERARGARGNKRKADGEESTALEDPGLKRNLNRRGRGGHFGRSQRGGPEKPTGVSKPSSAFTNDKDRDAAEARKKRFAAS